MDLPARSAAELKAILPIVYVLERYGHGVEDVGGKYAAVCPFHQDSHPSLDVYGERLERWGCFACGARGDVLDLVGRLAWPGGAPDFRIVRDFALTLLAEFEASDWTGPIEGIVRTFDPEVARITVASSALNDLRPVVTFLQAKWERGELLAVDADYLHTTWQVGSRCEEIIVPYFDRTGSLVTYKHRTADTKALAATGSPLKGMLYGEWLDDGHKPVLLVEGESDTWAAHRVAWDRYSVLGISTGVGDHPAAAGKLRGRHVTVAFDGDEAGRAGTLRWVMELGGAQVVHVPEGDDLASIQPNDLRALLTR